jgi:CheY-like chemotaxis protein
LPLLPYTVCEMAITECSLAPKTGYLGLARVLLVDDDPTSRLTLQTVLKAGGYHVDTAASASEAVGKLDERQYELVLSELQMESPQAGLKVLAHARMMVYKPATALITSRLEHESDPVDGAGGHSSVTWKKSSRKVLIEPEDLPELLGKVADLIGHRVTRQMRRELRLHRN